MTSAPRRLRGLICAPAWVATIALVTALSVANTAAAESDAEPGAAGDATLAQWTLKGPLPGAVSRATDDLPLSDQAGSEGWVLDAATSDEFNGDTLNDELWMPRHRSWRGRAPALFSEENVEVRDGRLRLWMRKNGAPRGDANPDYHTYTSAAVHAKKRTLYGYYEVRAKPMASAGSSSFWFAGTSDGWRTEIDVFELGGKAEGHENRVNMNLHVFWTPEDRSHRNWGGVWKAPRPLADDFHVYGLAWTPERITYYVDGSPVRWVDNGYWHQPIYTIFDSETMPDWLGTPEDDDLPSVYEIDYLRVWRKPVKRQAGLSRPGGNATR
ncbi:family 16 glycosylhydrolase [Botrimarina hoheduenensis]|uniref:Beta-porphyranase A n=1 Tax=Botrimarina hoheduenensis TaxID=2528000 RepID=A0A5C5VST9_9BACT|nr:family 16 glycosylhydrolase [Botrimarina hoheduenensis]TWT40642.1 Beta-porphyranase A precursor [Botrimarina hoheduenensis]